MGLEAWLDRELGGEWTAPDLERRLATLPSLALPLAEMLRLYPDPALVLRQARQAGVVSKDVDLLGDDEDAGKRQARRELMRYAREQGYRPQRELIGQLLAQKLCSAVYSREPAREVLTDFWFNHFNVSLTDNQARSYLLSYERDAIRAAALGKFRDLLGATARHPAMLLYLDNAQSTANPASRPRSRGAPTSAAAAGRRRVHGGLGDRRRIGFAGSEPHAERSSASGERHAAGRERPRGLNENYARELLELHTLGVDGGYTQEDVIEVARAFTGWTVLPPGGLADEARRRACARVGGAGGLGFVGATATSSSAPTPTTPRRRPCSARSSRPAAASRTAATCSTWWRAIRRPRATWRPRSPSRFVADEPPPALVDRLAQTFLDDRRRSARGDRARSPTRRSSGAATRAARKIKSPFELAASRAARRRGADASTIPRADRSEWIARMGQPLYAYQAPTGYPGSRRGLGLDRRRCSTRMNFGLQLAAGRVARRRRSISPRSTAGASRSRRDDALATYAALLLPERDLDVDARATSGRWCAIPSSAARRRARAGRRGGDRQRRRRAAARRRRRWTDRVGRSRRAASAPAPDRTHAQPDVARAGGRRDPRLAGVPAALRAV